MKCIRRPLMLMSGSWPLLTKPMPIVGREFAGSIDFLRYLGKQGQLYVSTGNAIRLPSHSNRSMAVQS